MKKYKQLITNQARIFPVDDLDFISISQNFFIKSLEQKYSIKKYQLPPNLPVPQQNSILLQHGEFQHDGEVYRIEQIIIETRKIIINVVANSKISDILFDDLIEHFKSLDSRPDPGVYEPLIKTYETTCILKLNNSIKNLFKIDYRKFGSEIMKKNNHGADIEIIPASVRFQVKYNNIPENLTNNKITISDKNFIVEIRDMSNPNDNLYYTVSPTDTDTHFQLLETLELMIKGD